MILYHGYAVRWINPAYAHEAEFIADEPESISGASREVEKIDMPAPRGQLMLLPLPDASKPHLRPRSKQRGHAGIPGQGPAGETCGTCAGYRTVNGGTRTFPKCELMRAKWTGGKGSDIRKSDPACGRWSAKEPDDGL